MDRIRKLMNESHRIHNRQFILNLLNTRRMQISINNILSIRKVNSMDIMNSICNLSNNSNKISNMDNISSRNKMKSNCIKCPISYLNRWISKMTRPNLKIIKTINPTTLNHKTNKLQQRVLLCEKPSLDLNKPHRNKTNTPRSRWRLVNQPSSKLFNF